MEAGKPTATDVETEDRVEFAEELYRDNRGTLDNSYNIECEIASPPGTDRVLASETNRPSSDADLDPDSDLPLDQ